MVLSSSSCVSSFDRGGACVYVGVRGWLRRRFLSSSNVGRRFQDFTNTLNVAIASSSLAVSFILSPLDQFNCFRGLFDFPART